ncbi:MAG: DUF2203 domain-containing protein [Chloroflexota bacterium]|jgi:hypothetical protein|nr:DUF2203 domain-containing protein [Chloroflexota bacterium]
MEPDQFTLDEANALIPWLAEKFQNLNLVRQEYVSIQERMNDPRINSGNEIEVSELKSTSDQLARQLEEGVEEILDQGIIVRDMSLGLVDFPSLRDNRDIYLCWIGGEVRVDYWHEVNQGFSHRQPI